jgi:hypothetical protein
MYLASFVTLERHATSALISIFSTHEVTSSFRLWIGRRRRWNRIGVRRLFVVVATRGIV